MPIKGIRIHDALGPRYRGIYVMSTGAIHVLLDDHVICGTPTDPSGTKRTDRVSKHSLCTRCRRALKAAGILA